MSEIPTWRKFALKMGIVSVLANPVLFIVAVNLARRSEKIWETAILIGFFVGIVSFLCAAIGKGPHRWKVLTAACLETFVWWFMAVGL
jgi:hypothetical protein